MDITIPNAVTQIKDAEGNLLLEADLFDLSHFIGHFMADYQSQFPEAEIRRPGMARLRMFQELTAQFNAFFGCHIGFSRMANLTVDIEAAIQELKKNQPTP